MEVYKGKRRKKIEKGKSEGDRKEKRREEKSENEL